MSTKNEKFLSKTKEQIERSLFNEITMGAKLKNEFLVNTIRTTQINHFYFFLMENMELGNLKSFHENKIDNCSELLCSFFIYQCLRGLHYMHSKLIVHKDIKLENILITSDYQIKLADFSMSTQLKQNYKYPTSRSGTIPYLPPECFCLKKIKATSENKNQKRLKLNDKDIKIISNNANNNKSNSNNEIHIFQKLLSPEASLKKDIFALGIVMYRLLYREHPFNYEYKMDRDTYGKKLKSSKLNFKGKELTSDCIDFLKGVLHHNVNKRFDIYKALNHIWIIKTQKIINYIINNNKGNNKENLISSINNYVIKDDYEPINNDEIFLDSSTKDSEDKDKEKSYLRLKRKRKDIKFI